jgi:hypothetical protein
VRAADEPAAIRPGHRQSGFVARGPVTDRRALRLIDVGGKCVDRRLRLMQMAMDGQGFSLLPPLNGANTAVQIRSNGFPGIQAFACGGLCVLSGRVALHEPCVALAKRMPRCATRAMTCPGATISAGRSCRGSPPTTGETPCRAEPFGMRRA